MSRTSAKKIYVALSGGVDSATVAAILVEKGFDVTGVYMKNWSSDFGIENNCPWEEDVADVEKVAKHLGIEWKTFNFEKEYRARVLQYFYDEYRAGRTPNPDILCNNLVKFDLFLNRARAEGAEAIATGHYARRAIQESPFSWEENKPLGLYTAIDESKDQGYFLQRLSQEQLSFATFPLGNLFKSEVRVLAKHYSLPVAAKKDSQGICFIGDIDVRDFLKRELKTKPGDIVDIDSGKTVGQHQGLWFYTIGQRQGLGIGGVEIPYYVVKKEQESNRIYVSHGRENEYLHAKEITIDAINEVSENILDNAKVWVSLRYREAPKKAMFHKSGDKKGTIVFDDYGWAPAPGQSALMYETNIAEASSAPSEDVSEIMKKVDLPNAERMTKILGGGIIV